MSLHLHLSAQPDDLLAKLRPKLAGARAASLVGSTGVPRPIPVLVPSTQMADWLQVRLARELGLSMGFEFLAPRAYFSRHLAASPVATAFAQANSYWTPECLRWHLLPHVGAIAQNLGHDPTHPLGPRDRFAFAQLLAQQFDRYARFRPDWPGRWAHDRSAWLAGAAPRTATAVADEAWQSELWRTLAAAPDAPAHPARLLAQLAEAAPEPLGPPTPLFVLGTDLLDPLLLRTLQVLAGRGHEISLFLLLPSLGFLGDISRRDRWRTQLNAEQPETVGAGHPLLASLGQLAVGTFLLLEEISPDYAGWPESPAIELPPHASLLQRLQADIHEQRLPPGRPAEADSPDLRADWSPDDCSVRVHSCHSPRRELEVLRDELLRAFADLPGLKPEDVLVAVTDFDVYAPLADGVLRAGSNPLPVRLTAIPAREANPLAVALLALLRLALGRRTASELIDLFNLTAVQHRLEVHGEPEVIAQLADIIRQSGLTHGLDRQDRREGESTGTWRAALDRHLAGTWFGPVAAARDADGTLVHPLASDLHHHDEAMGRLLAWLTSLAGHLREWSAEAPASVWSGRLARALDDLLVSELFDDHAAAVRRRLGELDTVTATIGLDAGTVLDWLASQLENATSLRTNLGGEILLGRLDQVHGLPCRVLAVLGLQDGAFPRVSRRPAWDLLAHDPERWDLDPRNQDRQWFLDALLAPTDRLILSAANRSLRTPHDGPLSSCVEELLRVAGDTVRPSDASSPLAAHLVVRHPMQPFTAEYFQAGGALPRSFDPAAARIAADLVAQAGAAATPFFAGALPPRETPPDEVPAVTLVQLIAFWREPARTWLGALQVEIAEEENDDTDLDESPVTLSGLQQYAVRSAALSARLPSSRIEATTLGERLAADRALPPGALGELSWEFHDREVSPLATSLAALLPTTEALAIDLAPASQLRLTGEVTVVGRGTPTPRVVTYRTSKYDKAAKYQLESFLRTLVAAVQLQQPVGGLVLGLDHSQPHELPAISPHEAGESLRALLAGYEAGLRQLLCFSPETSTVIVESLTKNPEVAVALDKARETWSREPFRDSPGGEGTTPAAVLAWRDADPFGPPHETDWLKWAAAVAAPLRSWWEAAKPTPRSRAGQ